MKKMEIIIRPSMFDKVKNVLSEMGIHGLNYVEIKGFGRQRGHTEVYRGTTMQVDCLPKTRLEVVLPDAMVENQLDGLINELRGHLQAQGVSLEQYLEAGNTTMEQLRDHARQQATAAARYELAMTEIARREGIDITEADLDAKYQELSRQYDLSVELLRQQLPPLRLRHDLKLAAAQAVVVDSAKRK